MSSTPRFLSRFRDPYFDFVRRICGESIEALRAMPAAHVVVPDDEPTAALRAITCETAFLLAHADLMRAANQRRHTV